MIFILCIMLHPEVQRRVHEELDREIGQERVPTLDELPSLIYLRAAWKECLRWHPVTPLGMWQCPQPLLGLEPSLTSFAARCDSYDYGGSDLSGVLDS